MQFDPKWVFYLGLLVTIETAIGQGAVKLTNVVPEAWIPYVVGWCNLLGFVGTATMTGMSAYSSKIAGPLVKSIVAVLMVGASLLALAPSDAHAQGPIARKIIAAKTGDPSGDISALVTKFYSITQDDLTSALAYAAATDDAPAIACYTAWLDEVNKITELRAQFPDKDGVQIITAFQKARNLIKRLSSGSKFRQSCAALAEDAKSDVNSFVSKLVTGAAIKAFLPIPF